MSSLSEMKHPNDKVRGKVEALSAAGYNQKYICEYLEIDAKTLRKHYRKELDTAMMERCMKVAERLFEMCMDPHNKNPAPLFFWLKCQSRGGWIEDGDLAEEMREKGVGKIQIEVLGSKKEEDKKDGVETIKEDEDKDSETIQ